MNLNGEHLMMQPLTQPLEIRQNSKILITENFKVTNLNENFEEKLTEMNFF